MGEWFDRDGAHDDDQVVVEYMTRLAEYGAFAGCLRCRIPTCCG